MRRVHPHTDGHGNQERWLLTYADMITLLTAFFLMLYSMSVTNKGKFSVLALSVRDSFSGVMRNGGGKILPSGAKTQSTGFMPDNKYLQYSQAMRDLHRYVEQNNLGKRVTTRNDSRGVIISLVADNMLFERGKAMLSPESSAVLAKVTDIVKSAPNDVVIEGHSCDIPIHTAQYPSNWELSTARASVILRYFTEQRNLPGKRFKASGCADTVPLLPNTSEDNRAKNRRVDIVLLKTDGQRLAELSRQTEIRRVLANDAAPDLGGTHSTSDGSSSGTPDRNESTGAADRAAQPTNEDDTNSAGTGANIIGRTPVQP